MMGEAQRYQVKHRVSRASSTYSVHNLTRAMRVAEINDEKGCRDSSFPYKPAFIEDILCHVAQGKGELGILSHNARHLEMAASQLVDQNKLKAGYITATQNRISPIFRLPVELLGEILIHCASISDILVDFLRNAMLVSYSWKSALFSIPQLWTTIDINPNTEYPLSPRKLLSFLRACLLHSKNFPLSIKCLGSPWDAMDQVSCSQYYSTLAPHVKRIQSFSSSIYFFTALLPFCHSGMQFPLLQHLHLEGGPLKFSIHAPKLFNLSLESISAVYQLDDTPWSHITSLRLAYCDSDTACKILENMSNVVSLQLGVSWVVGSGPNLANDNRIVLQNLEELELIPSAPASPVLGILSAPRLKSIKIYGHSPYESITQYACQLVLFLRRSACPLTCFTLHHYDLKLLMALLPEMGSVEHLHCGYLHSHSDSFTDVMMALSWTKSGGLNPLPRLRKFTMQANYAKGFEGLTEMIKSRNNNLDGKESFRGPLKFEEVCVVADSLPPFLLLHIRKIRDQLRGDNVKVGMSGI